MAPAITFHSNPEEVAESYCMQRMPPTEMAAYRLHVGKCPSCARAVEEQRIFIDAMRAAMRQVDTDRRHKHCRADLERA